LQGAIVVIGDRLADQRLHIAVVLPRVQASATDQLADLSLEEGHPVSHSTNSLCVVATARPGAVAPTYRKLIRRVSELWKTSAAPIPEAAEPAPSTPPPGTEYPTPKCRAQRQVRVRRRKPHL